MMDPKYIVVNGNLGADMRCFAYVQGPKRVAQDAKNKRDPIDQLRHNLVSIKVSNPSTCI